jgi:hypothetical protein
MPTNSSRTKKKTRKKLTSKSVTDKYKVCWPKHYIPRVIVKFYPEIKIPDRDSTFRDYLRQGKLGPWRQLLKDFDVPTLKMQRLITKLSPRKCRSLADKAKKANGASRPSRLENYFSVECRSRKDAEEIAKTLDAWNTTEIAYIEGGPTPSPVNRVGNTYGPQQTYLGPAPGGIDAEYAWTMPGGDGSGVKLKFADVEQGWYLNHPDLPSGIQLINGVNQNQAHGTAVLGIVVAQDNAIGCVGITPNLRSTMVSSIWPDPRTDYPDRYQAILAAIAKLEIGDVLLLELQVDTKGYYPGNDRLDWYGGLPAEVDSPLFELIQTATSNGIIVVEAAGNGGWDLDAFDPYAAPHWTKDSGAIMVAAVDAPAGRSGYSRRASSNYGSRINCFAWGDQIYAPYDLSGPQQYVAGFADTSGASAIIAGAALAIQGYAKTNLNRTLSPAEMRMVLSDPTTGTLSANATLTNPNADAIGVMPDLRKIIGNL